MTEEWWGGAEEVKGWTGHQLMSVYSTPKQLSLTVTTQSIGCDWPLKSSHAEPGVLQLAWFWKCSLWQGPRVPV